MSEDQCPGIASEITVRHAIASPSAPPAMRCRRLWPLVLLAVAFGAAPASAQLDIESIELFRFIDRDDGIPLAVDPYGGEACVVGVDIIGASVTPPGASAIALTQDPQASEEWCYFAAHADHASLVSEFPDGAYLFIIDGVGPVQDRKTLTMNAAEPGAYPDFTAPNDGATIQPNQDLNVGWSLVAKPNDPTCLQTAPSACADSLAISVFDQTNELDVYAALLAVESTADTVPGANLGPSLSFEIEVETFVGTINNIDTTDVLGDPIVSLAIYEDINLITVQTPEPAASVAGVVALGALLGLRRQRRLRTT